MPRYLSPEFQAITAAAEGPQAPQPTASQASAPQGRLRLSLSPAEIHALEEQQVPTLAQSAAAQLHAGGLSNGSNEVYSELDLGHGVTEVHSHGGCVRMVPSGRALADPFNYGGERLTAPCL